MTHDVRIIVKGVTTTYQTENVLGLLNWLTDYSDVYSAARTVRDIGRYSLFDTIEVGGRVYKLHHTALYGGYLSWYRNLWLDYSGKFGNGFAQHYNADKNKHSHRVAYYIEVK